MSQIMLCPLCTFLQASLAPELNVSGQRLPAHQHALCLLLYCLLSVVYALFLVFAFPSSHQVTPDGHAPQVFFFLMIKLSSFSEVLLEKDMPKVNWPFLRNYKLCGIKLKLTLVRLQRCKHHSRCHCVKVTEGTTQQTMREFFLAWPLIAYNPLENMQQWIKNGRKPYMRITCEKIDAA